MLKGSNDLSKPLDVDMTYMLNNVLDEQREGHSHTTCRWLLGLNIVCFDWITLKLTLKMHIFQS